MHIHCFLMFKKHVVHPYGRGCVEGNQIKHSNVFNRFDSELRGRKGVTVRFLALLIERADW